MSCRSEPYLMLIALDFFCLELCPLVLLLNTAGLKIHLSYAIKAKLNKLFGIRHFLVLISHLSFSDLSVTGRLFSIARIK